MWFSSSRKAREQTLLGGVNAIGGVTFGIYLLVYSGLYALAHVIFLIPCDLTTINALGFRRFVDIEFSSLVVIRVGGRLCHVVGLFRRRGQSSAPYW